MIERKDWEKLKEQLEAQQKNMEMSLAQDKVLLEFCNKKIDEDPAPKEIKEIAKALK